MLYFPEIAEQLGPACVTTNMESRGLTLTNLGKAPTQLEGLQATRVQQAST